MNRKNIPGFEEYSITEEGLILHGNKPLKIQMSKTGIPFVRLRKDNNYFTFSIAKLVLLTYIPDLRNSPSDIPYYKDGNNHNFSLSNLTWASRSESYSKLYDKTNRYSENRLLKLRKKICKPVVAIKKIDGQLVEDLRFESITEAAKHVHVAPASLIRCLKNQRYMCMGYHWKYVNKED